MGTIQRIAGGTTGDIALKDFPVTINTGAFSSISYVVHITAMGAGDSWLWQLSWGPADAAKVPAVTPESVSISATAIIAAAAVPQLSHMPLSSAADNVFNVTRAAVIVPNKVRVVRIVDGGTSTTTFSLYMITGGA